MKCPLLSVAWGAVAAKEAAWYPECLKENCAWWNEREKGCDPTGLVHILDGLTDTVIEILEKMPNVRHNY